MSDKDYFYYQESFLEKKIMNPLMKWTLPSLVVLFFIFLFKYIFCNVNLFFILTPLITLCVPIMVISFNNKKEINKNNHFLDILEDCVFEAVLSLKLEFLEFHKSSDNNFSESPFNNVTRDNIVNNVIDILIDELKIIEDSKLQFYDKDTFNKFIYYKRHIHKCSNDLKKNKLNSNIYSKKCYELYNNLISNNSGLKDKTIDNIKEINLERIKKHKCINR